MCVCVSTGRSCKFKKKCIKKIIKQLYITIFVDVVENQFSR